MNTSSVTLKIAKRLQFTFPDPFGMVSHTSRQQTVEDGAWGCKGYLPPLRFAVNQTLPKMREVGIVFLSPFFPAGFSDILQVMAQPSFSAKFRLGIRMAQYPATTLLSG